MREDDGIAAVEAPPIFALVDHARAVDAAHELLDPVALAEQALDQVQQFLRPPSRRSRDRDYSAPENSIHPYAGQFP